MYAHFDNKLYLTIMKGCSCNGNVYVQSVYLTGGFESFPTVVQVSPTTGSRCCIAMGSGAVGVFRASNDRCLKCLRFLLYQPHPSVRIM